jgi:hypothetical protein
MPKAMLSPDNVAHTSRLMGSLSGVEPFLIAVSGLIPPPLPGSVLQCAFFRGITGTGLIALDHKSVLIADRDLYGGHQPQCAAPARGAKLPANSPSSVPADRKLPQSRSSPSESPADCDDVAHGRALASGRHNRARHRGDRRIAGRGRRGDRVHCRPPIIWEAQKAGASTLRRLLMR